MLAAFKGVVPAVKAETHSPLFEELWPIFLLLRGQCRLDEPLKLADLCLYADRFDAGFVAFKQLLVLDADALYLAAVLRARAVKQTLEKRL